MSGQEGEAFGDSRVCFEDIAGWLAGSEAASLAHDQLEDGLDRRGRELLRRLFQDHLDLRGEREERVEVVTAQDVTHGSVEAGHTRELVVQRLAYRHRGAANLHPGDAVLNLPTERHSHGLRRLAGIESTRGSYDAAAEAMERATGVAVAKRQVEQLARCAAADVEDFYDASAPGPGADDDLLVISVDGKGIVMRPDSLRPTTEKAAAAVTNKLETRLSKGEKRYRKRMAEVGAVHDLQPVPRSPADVLASKGGEDTAPAPRAKAKWVTASVADDAAVVIGRVFDEAERRDPEQRRRWVALVDGNCHQIERIEAEAKKREVNVTVMVDLIHVLEYLWGAVWCFFSEGDGAAEEWVGDRALAVLEGKATDVAAGIRRRATTAGLANAKRKKADDCARYLVNKAAYSTTRPPSRPAGPSPPG